MSGVPHRIACCITELDPGGAERALVQVLTRLDKSKWEPHVWSLQDGGELVSTFSSAGIPVRSLGVTRRWDLGAVRRLRSELRAFRPALIQTYLFHANLVGRFAARRMRIPVVSGVRVIEHDARWRMRLDRWTNRWVDQNVCVSSAVASTYRQMGFAEDRLTVIPNGVDIEKFANADPADLAPFGIPDGARTLLAIGRLHPQKGFDLLLRASQPIFDQYTNAHLLIVGDGRQRSELSKIIRDSVHPDRVHLAGRQMDIPGLLHACEVFILSSRWEGMPNVVLEAMAAGKPVVATDVEGVNEIIETGENGITVAPESPPALTEGISRILGDPILADRLGSNAQTHVRRQFSWDYVVQRYDDLWSGLIDRNQNRRRRPDAAT